MAGIGAMETLAAASTYRRGGGHAEGRIAPALSPGAGSAAGVVPIAVG
jgi:hypothetical protein